MKIGPLAVSGALALGLLGCGPSWTTYESREGRFQVLFPTQPETSVATVDGVHGSSSEYGFLAFDEPRLFRDVFGFPSGYWVSYRDLPPQLYSDTPKHELLEQEKARLVSLSDGSVAGETDTAQAGDAGSGVEFVLRDEQGNLARTRLFLVGRRLYQVGVGTGKEQIYSGFADQFLESFKTLGAAR